MFQKFVKKKKLHLTENRNMNWHLRSSPKPTDLFAKSVSEMSCAAKQQSEYSVSGGSVSSRKLQQNVSCIFQTFL